MNTNKKSRYGGHVILTKGFYNIGIGLNSNKTYQKKKKKKERKPTTKQHQCRIG